MALIKMLTFKKPETNLISGVVKHRHIILIKIKRKLGHVASFLFHIS